jgi:7-dehydrocholesterol reductase
LGHGTIVVPLLLFFCPLFVQVLAYLTSAEAVTDKVDPKVGVSGFFTACSIQGWEACGNSVLDVVKTSMSITPTMDAVKFLVGFNTLALVLDVGLPGKLEYGPETLTGHVPEYVNNALLHCFVFTALFFAGSNLGPLGLYDFGIMFDVFPACISCLNIFGLVFALFLYYKGLNFPSTNDCGSSGSFLKDFTWGTELYPRVCGVDIKRFINCRFSMTYWMLAGLSYAYRSYTLHNETWDWGLVFAAISQFLYLVKFFEWEIGYMRSIDIIVDRAGWEIQWGCLVWVPSIYTLHSRFCVLHPSGLTFVQAASIFTIGMLGVALNYWADVQRKNFRENDGKGLVWGKPPVFVTAKYEVIDKKTKKTKTRTSLLLASGFWGIARHFHYVFELTAAWSWCVLANPAVNGALPLFYAVFLTILLTDRAKRDEKKCRGKYGKYYDEYSKKVPYLILPGVY